MAGNSRFAVSVHILAYLTYRRDAAVPSAEIASSVDTNPVVIRRLLGSLLKAKLVTAQKGATGGFALARNPEKISLRETPRNDKGGNDRWLNVFYRKVDTPEKVTLLVTLNHDR